MFRKFLLVLLVLGIPLTAMAEDTTTVEAKSEDISENLDLEAVASVFGESETLEDFEKRLNDPEAQITNLDMNEDGEVDYLRVLETVKGETHFIAIQAVIGEEKYQDVATIEVEKDSSGETQVQVVGDVYMYGPNYIVEPVYVQPPVLFVVFWTPYYSPWHSPWYWGYPPPYYHPWHPYPTHRYRTNVHVNINVNNSYNYTSVRKSKTSIELQDKNRRNDYGKNNPDKSFDKRNPGGDNKGKLKKDEAGKKAPKDPKKSTGKEGGRQVQEDWKPSAERKTPEKGNAAPKSGNLKNREPAPKKVEPPKTKPVPKTKPAPRTKSHPKGRRRR